MKALSVRALYFIAFLSIVCLLGLSFYLQLYDNVAPCPLCILQRLTVALLGIVFFLGAALSLKKIGHFLISAFATILSMLGIFFAGRQVWLQHLPVNQNADCGVSLDYMLRVLPLHEIFKKIVQGGAECSRVDWQFWNISLAEWSLYWFILFALLSIFQWSRKI